MTTYASRCTVEEFHPDTRAFFAGRTVAVTGGTGFIGSHLVEQLLMLGARPVVLALHGEPGYLRDSLGRIDLRPCNLQSYDETVDALEGASVVLNLAAVVAGLEYNSRHSASIFHQNMQMFLNAIKAAEKRKVERFLVTSSACVYPRFCSIPTPEEEGCTGEPEPTNSGYGWSKRMQEYLGAQYAAEFGLSVAIARPYNAYGPRDNFDPRTSHVIPALIRKAFETKNGEFAVWGDGSHSRSFLYVDDFARGLLEVAAKYPCARAVNLGAHEEITVGEIARMIAARVSEVRSTEIWPRFEPGGLTGQPRRCCDVSRAIRELGYRATVPLAQGLKRTIDWFARHENNALSAHP